MKKRMGFSSSSNVFIVNINDVIEVNNKFMSISNQFIKEKSISVKYKMSKDEINKLYDKSIEKVK